MKVINPHINKSKNEGHKPSHKQKTKTPRVNKGRGY